MIEWALKAICQGNENLEKYMKKKIRFRRLQSRERNKNLGHGCYREGLDYRNRISGVENIFTIFIF